MLFLRIHKWLISLALIVSIASFNGYTGDIVTVNNNQTELFVAKKLVNKAATYSYRTVNFEPNNSYNFSFNTLLENYNSINGLQFKALKKSALQYVNHINFKSLIHSINQDDYYRIFIG